MDIIRSLHSFNLSLCVHTRDSRHELMMARRSDRFRISLFSCLLLFICASVDVVDGANVHPINQSCKEITESQVAFTSKFYHSLIGITARKSNFVISPVSVYILLAMLRHGTAKQSRVQITKAMQLSKVQDVNTAITNFSKSILMDQQSMNLFNKIWQQKYFCITRCRQFAGEIKRIFQADVGEVNFHENAQQAILAINRWAYVTSRGRIKSLVDESDVTQATRFVLTNMIYFKANWKQIFQEKRTHKRLFSFLQNGERIDKYVETMFSYGQYRHTYGFGDDYSLLELPYEDENFSMIIILPLSIKNFDKIEGSLNFAHLNSMINRLNRRPKGSTNVFLPKFCISNGMGLNDALKSMGLTDIFDPFLADLSNISGFKGMYVSNVQHEAFIKVTEHGTEAAGGSSASSADLSLSDDFRVDRPFMFLIRHVPTQSIVFFGKITDPSLQDTKCGQ